MGRPRKVKPAVTGDSSPVAEPTTTAVEAEAIIEAVEESVPVPAEVPAFPRTLKVKNNTASRQSFPFIDVAVNPHGSADAVFISEAKLVRFKSVMSQLNALYGYDAIGLTGE